MTLQLHQNIFGLQFCQGAHSVHLTNLQERLAAWCSDSLVTMQNAVAAKLDAIERAQRGGHGLDTGEQKRARESRRVMWNSWLSCDEDTDGLVVWQRRTVQAQVPASLLCRRIRRCSCPRGLVQKDRPKWRDCDEAGCACYTLSYY